MVHRYKRKTERQNWNPSAMREAMVAVEGGLAVRAAAKRFGVPRMSLKRRVKGKNTVATNEQKILGSKRPVFTSEQEIELVDHILNMEHRMYGLTTLDVRKLAYQLAEKNNILHPFSHEEEAAGKDWLIGFRKRHPELSLRTPESTSLARTSAFNKPVVDKFFSLLKELMDKTFFPPHRVFNVDETSISTVPGRNCKILAEKGKRQVGQVVSAERGESTTAVICASASGFFVPPMLIFARKRMKPELMTGAPPGSTYFCNDSGWMKLEAFQKWFDHFLLHAKPTVDDPVLLILDGHLSHTKNIAVIEKARVNFVTILCLPPHCTHKLQPLDVGFMFALNTWHDKSLKKWLTNSNQKGRVRANEIAKIFCEAYLQACVPLNAINGFKKTGIVPFNPDVFSEIDFVAAEVTNKPDPVTPGYCQEQDGNLELVGLSQELQLVATTISSAEENPVPGPSHHGSPSTALKMCDSPKSFSFSPRDIHPFPKKTKSRTSRKRKLMESAILTSSPYKNQLILEKKNKEHKEIIKQAAATKKIQLKNAKSKNEIARTSKEKSLKSKQRRIPIKKKRVPKNQDLEYSETDSEDGHKCIYCDELFSASAAGEGWIQCHKCRKWAHDACAGIDENHDDVYLCDMCSNIPSLRMWRK